MALSIIIPALNEAVALPDTLASVQALEPEPKEVILVDGGSSDETVEIAKNFGATVLKSECANRALQMNLGAEAAQGDALCFLHADTRVPLDFVSLARAVLSDERTVLAGFVSLMTGPQKTRWFTSAHNFLKTYYAPILFRPISFLRGGRLLFGDQVLICRADDFRAINGFDPDQKIMEEADFCLRMARAGRGRTRQVHRIVRSSDRRVAEWGGLRANLKFIQIGVAWGLGRSAETLAEGYEDIRS